MKRRISFISPQNSYVGGYQRNNENDRFQSRNRNSSLNEYSRQEGRTQQQNQSFSSFNRNDNDFSPQRRSRNPSPSTFQRSTENFEDDVNSTPPKRTRQVNEDAPKEEQNPWERATRQ